MGYVEQPLPDNCNDPANCCIPPVVCSATLADKKLSSAITEQIGCGAKPFILSQTTTSDIATGAVAMVTSITRNGAPVFDTTVTVQGKVIKVTVTYGAGFKGVTESSITNDGKFTTGEINGRAIVPLPAGADPKTTTFQDGLPPPDYHVDDDTKKALTQLLQMVKQDVKACLAAAPPVNPEPPPQPPPPVDPDDHSIPGTPAAAEGTSNSANCQVCQDGCGVGLATCVILAAIAALECGPFFPVCFGLGAAGCTFGYVVCTVQCNQPGNACCPVGCGNQCCNDDDICASNQTGLCCPAGNSVCNGHTTCCTGGTNCMPNSSNCCPQQYGKCLGGAGASCCDTTTQKEACLNGLPSSGCCPNGPGPTDMRCGATVPNCVPPQCDPKFTLCCKSGELCLGKAPDGTGGNCVPCNPAAGDQICGPNCCQAGSGAPTCSDPATGTCCGAAADCPGAPNSVNGCCPVDPNSPFKQLVCVPPPNPAFPPVCCEPYAACDTFCCGNEATCIKPPNANLRQFCCPNNQACGGACCAPDQPCGIGFPSLTKVCCAAPNTFCFNPANPSRPECCEAPTQCMAVGGNGNMVCCEPEWLCGNGSNQVCCAPPGVCTLNPNGSGDICVL